MKKLKNSTEYNDLKSTNEYEYITISHFNYNNSNIKNLLKSSEWIDSTITGPSKIFIKLNNN